MTVNLNNHNNEPILVLSFESPFDPLQDYQRGSQLVMQTISRLRGEINLVLDLRDYHVDFNSLAVGMVELARQEAQRFERFRVMYVGHSRMVRLLARAAGQNHEGPVSVQHHNDMEAALAACRAS